MRIYTVEHEIAALNPTGGDGLLVVEAPNDLVLQVIRTAVYNLSTDTHEQLEAETAPITTKGSLAGGGSAPTPRKHDNGDAASSVSVYEAGNSGLSTEPTTWGDPYDGQGFSNLAGYEYEPPVDARPTISPSGLFGVRLMAAPSGAFKAKVVITFGEIGG
jgi:hypothetical protein